MVAAAILGLAGCASSGIQTEASEFVDQHGAAAIRAAAATLATEREASALSSPPDQSTSQRLARAAARARHETVQASDWSVGGGGGEGGGVDEEEDLPRAEAQVTEAARELASALSAVQTYARARSAAALARYRGKLARGREQWDEGISEIWHLAHRANPPTV